MFANLPSLVVTATPVSNMPDRNAQCFPDVFSPFAVTRIMSKDQPELEVEDHVTKLNVGSSVPVLSSLFVSRSDLASEQQVDPILGEYFDQVLSEGDGESALKVYLLQDKLLVRKWMPHGHDFLVDPVFQIVVPEKFRQEVQIFLLAPSETGCVFVH